jgi:1,2-beta-oligoglucan phosphorylase
VTSALGLRYGLLHIIHAVSGDLLSPSQAREHLDVVKEHLLGPDGARLFDRPAHYHGGPMEVFQPAEASTFSGREIGIMYTHAHLRYAEALARYGDAERLLQALALANPIGVRSRVASAMPRQSTCYYSSSDASFADRYEAGAHYGEVIEGTVPLEGGWRVYSSGPGIFLRLIVECLLGVRRRGDRLEIDPVLAPGLDRLQATPSTVHPWTSPSGSALAALDPWRWS